MSDLLSTILHSTTITHLGWTLLHSLWQDAAVAALLFLILSLLPKSSAPLRYLAAATALLLTLFLPLITFQYLNTTAVISTQTTRALTLALPTQNSNYQLPVTNYPAQPTTPISTKTLPTPPPSAFTLQSLLPVLVTLWTLGVLLLSLYHLGGWIALQRLRSLHNTPAPSALLLTLDSLAKKMHITRPLTLSLSPLITTPLVIGFLRPLILLPTTLLTGLSQTQLQAILAHELAHIRRHDYLVNLLQTLIETLLFYHPAVWWISAHIRQEREHCCDDLAASLIGDPLLYAEALLSIEELRAPNSPQNNLALAATGGHLFTRIQRLILPASTRRSHKPISLAAILLTLLLLSIPLWPTHQKARAQTLSLPSTTAPAATMNYDPAKLVNPVTLIKGTLLETGTERPVPDARIDLNGGRNSIELTTDADGHFSYTVPIGNWEVWFASLNSQDVFLSAPAVSRSVHTALYVDGSVSTIPVTLHIPPILSTSTIHGKILMPDGSPAAGLLVSPEVEDLSHAYFVLFSRTAQKTAKDGTFSVDSIPAGWTVHLYAELLKQHLALTADVPTRSDIQNRTVNTFTLQPTSSADILITDAHNRPRSHLEVTIQPTYNEQGIWNMTRKFTTDENGRLKADGIVPGLFYRLTDFNAKYHVTIPLIAAVTQPPRSSAILDVILPLRVRDADNNIIPINKIQRVVNSSTSETGSAAIKDRLGNGYILINQKDAFDAHLGNTVTLYFTSTDGLPRIATAPYTVIADRVEFIAAPDTVGIELATSPADLKPDEYGGNIIDAAGNPIAGAHVNTPDFIPYVPGNLQTLTKTDASGHFRFSASKAPTAFYFQIDQPGYARRWFFADELPRGKPFNIRLDNTTHVQATIQFMDNSPAAYATFTALTSIKLISENTINPDFQTTVVADANGRVDLPLTPGAWEFRAASPDQKQFARLPNMDIHPGQILKQLVTLSPGIRLKVQTLDSITKKPVSDVKLSMELHYPYASYEQSGTTRTTDDHGMAEWNNLMPGANVIRISKENYGRWTTASVPENDIHGNDVSSLGFIPLTLTPNMSNTIVMLEPYMHLTGKVLTNAGNPAPKLRVSIQEFGDDAGFYQSITNSNGEFTLFVPGGSNYKFASLTLIATDPDDKTYSPKASSPPFACAPGIYKSFTLTLNNP